MSYIDWTIIIFYLLGMIALAVWAGKGQRDEEDYYVAGRSLPWWALGLSTMATQSSANSFIGIPAYVALAAGGGLTWLQYELAVPLAIIFIMIFLLPFFRKLRLVSVYEYLEKRFDSRTRYFMSAVFLLSRSVGTGAGFYAAGIVISVCLGISITASILLIGIITIIYDTIGGMKGVVYSDVVQLVILLGGLIACIWYTASHVGGFAAMISSLPPERWQSIDLSTGLGDGGKAPFWAFLFGGFFLYASYYGVDQSQAQRALSARSVDDTKRTLVLNGLARFPLTILYLLLGVAAGAAYLKFPQIQQAVPLDRPDFLVPQLIIHLLPEGLRALLLAALLAAAMSSLDSALNSISAVTVRDFIQRGRTFSPKRILLISKLTTVGWGLLITLFALFVDKETPVVVTINKIGSAFYGPMLAAFVLGVLSKRIAGPEVIFGVIAGVSVNMFIWISGTNIFWMWWNLIGFVCTVIFSFLGSFFSSQPTNEVINKYTLSGADVLSTERAWAKTYLGLVIYFFAMLIISFSLSRIGAN